MAAAPNKGHKAIAELAKAKPGFLAITQNIDGTPPLHPGSGRTDRKGLNLSQRAGHPPGQLAPLHGSLFTIKCFDENCTFFEPYSSTDRAASAPLDCSIGGHSRVAEADMLSVPSLPTCATCGSSLLRPGVVWFGELLPLAILDHIDSWIDSIPRLDVMLVVGTEAALSRSAEFIDRAREKGAIIAHFNTHLNENLQDPEDFFF